MGGRGGAEGGDRTHLHRWRKGGGEGRGVVEGCEGNQASSRLRTQQREPHPCPGPSPPPAKGNARCVSDGPAHVLEADHERVE